MAVCFIGHRTVEDRDAIYSCLFATTERLIQEGHHRFLLGSHSEFNSMAVSILKELKEKYPHIERIYIRAEYPVIDKDYHAFLLESFEDTYFPDVLLNSGRSCYVQRNRILIDKSSVCVFYCRRESSLSTVQNENDLFPRKRKSGTHAAYDYAVKRGKRIINFSVY